MAPRTAGWRSAEQQASGVSARAGMELQASKEVSLYSLGDIDMKPICAALLTCLLIPCAYAAETESATATSAEQFFVTKAIQNGMAEVQLGKLTQSRATDPAVKKFGAQMIKDHEKANAELSSIAKAKNLEVPTELDGEHATVMHRMSAKPASEFDSEYGKQMIEAHQAAVTLFSDAAALSDKQLAAFAKKTLPTLKHHQQMAGMLPARMPTRPEGASPTDPPASALPGPGAPVQ
jgi:putative membrane protein